MVPHHVLHDVLHDAQIGFSIGARLIFHCLLELARCGARGIVESVVLLGTPVSINSHR